jgi:hypothetical protein
MDSGNKKELITLSELAYETGYSDKQIIKWVNDGVLLQKEKKESLGGRQGTKSYYLRENLERLQVFRCYENTCGKKPGKVGGIDFLFHLLFICGFSSPEIYDIEKKVIEQSARLFVANYDENIIDLTSTIINIRDYLIQNAPFVRILKNIGQIINRKIDTGLAKIFNDAAVCSLTQLLIINQPDFLEYAKIAHRININSLKRIQDGICMLLAIAVGFPHRRREEISNILDFRVNEFNHFLSKNNLLNPFPQNETNDFINFFFSLNTAVVFPIIFFFLRSYDEYVNEIKLEFLEEELDKIPN